MKRQSGILLHISSLPGAYGIGTLGQEAYRFADFLRAAGQRVWQLLPLGPTGYGDSPYQSFSAFAGNPYFIDLSMLAEEGLLTRSELAAHAWGNDPGRVDYAAVYEHRFAVLRCAWQRDTKTDLAPFRRENPWVEDYALFMALKSAHGMRAWEHWEAPLRRRESAALRDARARLRGETDFYIYLQYQFFRQWNALRRYVNARGIRLLGDMPIYVPYDSADVWCAQELFQLDDGGAPTAVAGCPPDCFSEDGQLWGNPLYRWEEHRKTDFAWWTARLSGAARLFDILRIDHFRGLESYWSVPAGRPNARVGAWVKGPGRDFIDALRRKLPDTPLIAEDLGYLTPEVAALLSYSGFPGMKVLEFAFDSDDERQLPEHYAQNSVCYAGTHDNAPLVQWLEEAPAQTKERALRYLRLTDEARLPEALLRCGMASPSGLFVMQLQDALHLGRGARMNLPGTLSTDNWSWRLRGGELSCALAETIRSLTAEGGRLWAEDV